MEIKVKQVDGPGQKSMQEVQDELMKNKEAAESQEVENTATDVVEEQPVEQEVTKTDEGFSEKDVLSFIKDRYNKEINSVDELFAQREQNDELPEDVSAFLNYKKETGRGIKDFMKLQANYDEMSPDQVLRDYYAATENDLDSEDIDYLMGQKFSYDEDLDEDSDIKAKKIAKKRELAKAKKYFNDLKETYKAPVESTADFVSQDEKETYESYKKYIQEAQSVQEENIKRSEYFVKKTEELFNDDFKGFEYTINDQKFVFNPGDTQKTKDAQSDVTNFISMFLDENGMINNPSGYHKALAAAMNADKMAAFFYEKGKADAVDNISRQSKNINMDVRQSPKSQTKSGTQIRAVSGPSSRGLKIKSKR